MICPVVTKLAEVLPALEDAAGPEYVEGLELVWWNKKPPFASRY